MTKAILKSKRVPLEFKTDTACVQRGRAINAALVDAIAAEDDSDDWSELEAMHRAQRRARGTAKHAGQR